MYLYEGAHQRNVMMMLHALALGADKNFVNENDQGRTPLIQTILSVSDSDYSINQIKNPFFFVQRSVAAAEFILINNAKVNLSDQEGKTPLHYATQLTAQGRG